MESGRSTKLGKYQLVAEIARGGMGIVYLAIATGPARFSKLLVVKELKPDLAEDPAFTEMFLEEARLAARLNHPNIVQTYEIGADEGRHYMVLDYLEGVTLARVLRKRSPNFSRAMHLRVICEMLQGLQYAHELKDFDGTALGMVHRDVSPQNVFITYDGQCKLVDFGIAKAFDSAVETRTGMLKGKPSYMAPEQMQGQVDTRADIYPAGVMIWEAVAGRRMWHRKSDIEVLASLVSGAIPSLIEAAPDAPEELVRIANRALARKPDDRYATAAELRNELDAYLKSANEVVTMREVAEVPSELFKVERETTRTTIEAHLARIKSGKDPDKLPSIRPPAMESPTTPSLKGLNADGSESSINSVPPSSFTSQPSSPSSPNSGSLRSLLTPSMQTPSGSEIPVYEDAPKQRKGPLVLAVLIGGAIVGLGMYSLARRTAPVAVIPVASSTPVAAGGPASATAKTPDISAPYAIAVADAAIAVNVTPPTPTPTSKGRPTWTPPTHGSKEKETTASTQTSEPEAVEPPSSGTGFLTLDTFPWTHVTMGGRALGDTPLVHVSIPAGTHTLSLDNPDENVHKSTTVSVKAGETISRRLAF